MLRKIFGLLALLCICFGSLGTISPAADPPVDEASSSLQHEHLLLKIHPVESPREVTAPLEIRVVVIATGETVRDLRELRWSVSEAVRGRAGFSDLVNDKKAGWFEGWTEEQPSLDQPQRLNVYEPFEYRFRLPQGGIDWRRVLPSFNEREPSVARRISLFFNGGKYKIAINAKGAKDAAAKGPAPADITDFIEVEFLPPPVALLLGGLSGVILLTIFERLLDLSLRLHKGRLPRKSSGGLNWVQLRQTGVTWAVTQCFTGAVQLGLGATVVLISLVLIGQAQGRDLPVNFKINGFFTALIVGLCMHLLVTRIYQRFSAMPLQPKQRGTRQESAPRDPVTTNDVDSPGRTVDF